MNLSCSNQDACPLILDSKCVIYEGENLLYIGVNTNDNLRVSLQKINDTIANLVLSGAGITELVGDVIAVGPGITSATLATVNSTPGQYGSSTAIPKITVDGKGRVTAISTDPVFIPSGALDFFGDVSGSGTTGSPVQLTLSTVNPNVYAGNTFLKFGVNGKGLITSATPVVSSDITTALGYTPAPSGNYITQLTGEATASGPGVANITLSDAAVVAKVLTGLNITGGSVVDTDSLLIAIGKIQNQLNALYGGVQFQSVWNASTNTPFLQSGVGVKGHYYIVSVPGSTNLDGITDWALGDWAIFDGTAWQQVDNTDAVVSVNGFTGAVSLTTDNIPEGAINQYYTTARARLALSGGTGISYDNITGVITNTLDLSGYVPYNGATGPVNLGNYNLTVKEIVIGTGAKDNSNIAIGRNSMSYIPGGVNNLAIGVDALYFYNGNDSVVLGYQAGYYLNSGSSNVVIGSQAAYGAGPLSNSVAIGKEALRYNQGTGNTAIGYLAGQSLSGNYNTIIGAYDAPLSANNNIFITDGQGNIRYRYDGTNNNFYQKVIFGSTLGNGTYTYTLPGATGTLALLSDIPSLTGYVPYTGATTNVDLGTYGLISDYLQLNNVPTSVPTTAGTMSWNDSYGTMDIKLKRGNVTLQTGQENVVPVINKTGTNLLESNYQAVRVRTAAEGGAQGQRLAVLLAQATNDANSATTIGIVTENIADNQEGFITVFGNVSEINTTGSLQGETWVDGDILYLSPTTPGAITNIKPVAPQHLITIGYVVYAHSQHGIIFVKVDNGYELEELHNVYAPDASKVNNQVLTWNASTSLWVNKSITDILGYTPVSGNGTVNKIAKWNGSNSIGNSIIYDDGTNVGIGTIYPSFKLQVEGNGFFNSYLFIANGEEIRFTTNNIAIRPALSGPSWSDLTFVTAGIEQVRITGVGLVGIGTSSPNSLLNVVGNSSTNGLTIKSAGNGGTFPFRVTWSGGSDGSMFCVNDNGNIGIGTSNPTHLLSLYSTTETAIKFQNAGAVRAYIYANSGELAFNSLTSNPINFYSNDVQKMQLSATGNLTIAGILTENSSIRYKKNIEDLLVSPENIFNLRPVSYVKKDTGLTEIGLIAEEVETLIPQLVNFDKEGRADGVNYTRLSVVLLAGFKYLKTELDKIKEDGKSSS